MSATANDLKHLYLHRTQGQTLVFEVRGEKFVVNVGRIDATRRKVTLDIIASPVVKVTRGELLVHEGHRP